MRKTTLSVFVLSLLLISVYAQASAPLQIIPIQDFPSQIIAGNSYSVSYELVNIENRELPTFVKIRVTDTLFDSGVSLSDFDLFSLSVNGDVSDCDFIGEAIVCYNQTNEYRIQSLSTNYLNISFAFKPNFMPSVYEFSVDILPFGNYTSESTVSIYNQIVEVEFINNTLNETLIVPIIIAPDVVVDVTLNPLEQYSYATIEEEDIAIIPLSSGVVINPENTFYSSATKELTVQLLGEGSKGIVVWCPSRPEKIWIDNKEIPFEWDEENKQAKFTVVLSTHIVVMSWYKPEEIEKEEMHYYFGGYKLRKTLNETLEELNMTREELNEVLRKLNTTEFLYNMTMEEKEFLQEFIDKRLGNVTAELLEEQEKIASDLRSLSFIMIWLAIIASCVLFMYINNKRRKK